MEQLGAKAVEISKDEVLEVVFGRIEVFEQKLDEDQKEYLDYVYKDRDVRKCKIKFPFLRSTHKIQKMSSEEIERKDTSNLKFRPVIDAMRWATRGYASLSMKMMRKAINELLSLAGPVMGKMKVKNGWKFAKELQEYEFEERYGIMMSADIQEAYTNITAKMINESIGFVCKYLDYPEWKIELMKNIIILVLKNNYVETSVGVFLFKMVLPMGYKLSGEALDIVAISGEMSKMLNLGLPVRNNIGMPIGEILEYPEDLVEADVENEVNMARGIKNYKRYVDDTHGIITGNEVGMIINGLLAIGYMFPVGLVINLDLNIWRSEFLDVFSWRGLTSGLISTMVKRNYNVPFGHVKKGSDHPEKYKMQSLLGEMLRNRRLGSDEEIVTKMDESILENFVSLGYTRRQVENEMSSALSRINSKYSSQYVKIGGDVDERKFQYGGGIVYNSNYKYNGILVEFIIKCKPETAPKLSLIPGTKLKNIAYTKRRYLKRQQQDLDGKKFKCGRK